MGLQCTCVPQRLNVEVPGGKMSQIKNVFLLFIGGFVSQTAFAAALLGTISFTTPATTYINKANLASLGLGGSCSTVNGQISIQLGTYGSASAVCSAGQTWSVTNIDSSSWAEGAISIKAFYVAQ